MTDDIPTIAEALDEFRHERTCRVGETSDDIVQRINARVSKEHRHLRDCIVELGTSEAPDHEVRRRLRQLAKGILVRKAAYAEWRKEYQAQFSTGAPGA